MDLHFCWAMNCGLIDWVLIMIGSIYQLLISMLDAWCLMRAWWFTAHSSWPMGARPPALAMSLNPWKINSAWSSKHQAPGYQATIKRSKDESTRLLCYTVIWVSDPPPRLKFAQIGRLILGMGEPFRFLFLCSGTKNTSLCNTKTRPLKIRSKL